MSVKPLPPVRRIVTGLRADGSSYFVADGPTPALLKVPERPGYSCENLWRTSGPVTRIDEPESVLQQRGVAPPRQGTVIRTLDIPPEAKDPAERARLAQATFRAMFPDLLHSPHTPKPGSHPAHHTTDTIDYAVVLQGEIWAIMDEGEKLMRAGDVLIQRGTPHAWSNRSEQICRILFVLIDAQR
jgi:hypothetical protein